MVGVCPTTAAEPSWINRIAAEIKYMPTACNNKYEQTEIQSNRMTKTHILQYTEFLSITSYKAHRHTSNAVKHQPLLLLSIFIWREKTKCYSQLSLVP